MRMTFRNVSESCIMKLVETFDNITTEMIIRKSITTMDIINRDIKKYLPLNHITMLQYAKQVSHYKTGVSQCKLITKTKVRFLAYSLQWKIKCNN